MDLLFAGSRRRDDFSTLAMCHELRRILTLDGGDAYREGTCVGDVTVVSECV